MKDLIITNIEPVERYCLCCGKKIKVMPWETQEFCNSCYVISVKEIFKEENGNLTCQEMIKKIRAEVKKVTI